MSERNLADEIILDDVLEEPETAGEASDNQEDITPEPEETVKKADPPQVKEESEKFYQTKYQELKQEFDAVNDKLSKFTNYEPPEIHKSADPVDDDDIDMEDRIVNKLIAKIDKRESDKRQQEIQRMYDSEVKEVRSEFTKTVNKYKIPKDIYEAAMLEAESIIPDINSVGAPSRRYKLILKELKPWIVDNAKKSVKEQEILDDNKKLESLKRIQQPTGSPILVPVEEQKTPAQKEADAIIPDDDWQPEF